MRADEEKNEDDLDAWACACVCGPPSLADSKEECALTAVEVSRGSD